MRLARLFSSSSFRLTLQFAGLFGVSALALFGAVYWTATDYMHAQFDATIRAQLASLREDGRDGGSSRLAALIDQRIGSPRHHSFFYLLRDAEGRQLVGNLSVGPGAGAADGWSEFPIPGPEGESDHAVRAWTVELSGGGTLLVGQDIYQLDEVLELMLRVFVWGIGATLVLAIGGGILASAGLLRRLETINRTSREIIEGDLKRRILVTGAHDDFDRLAIHLNAMLDRIQALMDDVRQVSNDIAHDLRTPLARLRQRLEAARLGAPSVAAYEVAIDHALAETDDILATFGALLRIAQIDSGSRRAGFTEVDLSSVVASVVETYAPVAENDDHSIVAEIPAAIHARGDRELIIQMLANLIENSLTHTPTGTHIRISVEAGADGVSVVVADDGPGIPAAESDKVLRRFYRLDASRGTPGNGLGLSLAAAVVALHGGRIALSDNHPGLRITVTFPTRRLGRA